VSNVMMKLDRAIHRLNVKHWEPFHSAETHEYGIKPAARFQKPCQHRTLSINSQQQMVSIQPNNMKRDIGRVGYCSFVAALPLS
jgi:hypothetical protein